MESLGGTLADLGDVTLGLREMNLCLRDRYPDSVEGVDRGLGGCYVKTRD